MHNKYSFTTPHKKPLLKEDTKLWLTFILISIILYSSFSLFLIFKSYLFKKDITNYKKEIITLNTKIEEIQKEKKFILTQKEFYNSILVKNSLIEKNIKNILELIPDPITINKIYFFKNRLIIYGITPTKDIYNVLMLPPLESIFTKTTTYFYQMKNGWYSFKSINILKEENEKD